MACCSTLSWASKRWIPACAFLSRGRSPAYALAWDVRCWSLATRSGRGSCPEPASRVRNPRRSRQSIRTDPGAERDGPREAKHTSCRSFFAPAARMQRPRRSGMGSYLAAIYKQPTLQELFRAAHSVSAAASLRFPTSARPVGRSGANRGESGGKRRPINVWKAPCAPAFLKLRGASPRCRRALRGGGVANVGQEENKHRSHARPRLVWA